MNHERNQTVGHSAMPTTLFKKRLVCLVRGLNAMVKSYVDIAGYATLKLAKEKGRLSISKLYHLPCQRSG